MAVTLTPKRFTPVGGAVDFMPDTQTAVYTAPAGTTGVIEKIVIANTDSVDRTFSMWIGGTGNANIIAKNENVVAGESFAENRVRVVPPGASLYVQASVANALTLIVDGVEYAVSGDPDATVPKQLFQGFTLGGGDVVYVPTTPIAVVHTITLVNTDTNPHDFLIYTEFTNSGRYYKGLLAPGARFVSPPGAHVIAGATDLSAGHDFVEDPVADAVTITVDGAEVSV